MNDRFCINCGNKINASAKFCKSCGAKTNAVPSAQGSSVSEMTENMPNDMPNVFADALKNLCRNVFKVFTDIRRIIIAILAALLWAVMIFFTANISLPWFVDLFNFLTFSYGGIGTNVFAIIGGLFGKAFYLGFISLFIVAIARKNIRLSAILGKLKHVPGILAGIAADYKFILAGSGISLILINFLQGSLMPLKAIISLFILFYAISSFDSRENFIYKAFYSFIKNQKKTNSALLGVCFGSVLAFVLSLLRLRYFGYIIGGVLIFAAVILAVLLKNKRGGAAKASTRLTMFVLLSSFAALTLFPLTARASSGEMTYNGMDVSYSISGVSEESSADENPWALIRTITGSVTGNTISLTANVKQSSGYGASIYARCGDQLYNKSIKVGESDSFSLSFPVTDNMKSVKVFIRTIGDYNAGTRTIEIEGTFENPNYKDPAESTAEEQNPEETIHNIYKKDDGKRYQGPPSGVTLIMDLNMPWNISHASGQVIAAPDNDLDDDRIVSIGDTYPKGYTITTGGDSELYIECADGVTYKLGSRCKVIIAPRDPEPRPSKTRVVAGEIMSNIYKMITTGQLDVTMNQGVLGTKGTTIITYEEDGKSILKVLEGKAYFTSLVTGEKIYVRGGEMAAVGSDGKIELTKIDVKEELDWLAEFAHNDEFIESVKAAIGREKIYLKEAIMISVFGLISALAGVSFIPERKRRIKNN